MTKQSPKRSKPVAPLANAKVNPPAGSFQVTPAPARNAGPANTAEVKPARKTKATSPKRKGRSSPSGLDAAAKVLSQSREPMRCGDLVKKMLDKGLWKTSGKTPAATINAAIIRDIRTNGKTSRFRKAGRGLFTAAQVKG